MAIDSKYGRVTTERGDIAPDEPVVVFRSKDKLLPQVLEAYRDLCVQMGSPRHHVEGIEQTLDTVLAWQRDHYTQVPQSAPAEGGDRA